MCGGLDYCLWLIGDIYILEDNIDIVSQQGKDTFKVAWFKMSICH